MKKEIRDFWFNIKKSIKVFRSQLKPKGRDFNKEAQSITRLLFCLQGEDLSTKESIELKKLTDKDFDAELLKRWDAGKEEMEVIKNYFEKK